MRYVIMGCLTGLMVGLLGIPASGWRYWFITFWVGAVVIIFEELARCRAKGVHDDAYQRGWKASEKYFQMMQRYKGAGE